MPLSFKLGNARYYTLGCTQCTKFTGKFSRSTGRATRKCYRSVAKVASLTFNLYTEKNTVVVALILK